MTMTASDHISVHRMQCAFRVSGLTAGQIAVRLGWYTRGNTPDASRVKRSLGLAAQRSKGEVHWVKTMPYNRAVMFIRAMDLAPVDYDL